MHHTSVFWPLFGTVECKFFIASSDFTPPPPPPPALCPGPARELTASLRPPAVQDNDFWSLHIVLSAQFGTTGHTQSLHKFTYIYPIFLLLMSYNTRYFYLKLPINHTIFCSGYACRPAVVSRG